MLERSSYIFIWMTNLVGYFMVTKPLMTSYHSLVGQGLSLCISEEVACEIKGKKARRKRLFRNDDQI